MNKKNESILSKGFVINNQYTITFFLKQGSYAESYRVKTQAGKTRFLKLVAYNKLHSTQFAESGDVLEIEILKKAKHSNVAQYESSGDIVIEGKKYAWFVLEFISGETLADKMKRQQKFNPYEAKEIISGVLNGLKYLHNLEDAVIHNEITNLNVMLDLSGQVTVPKIIDFGYARYFRQSNKDFMQEGLDPFYLANEAFNGVFSGQSDIFSVGVLYYRLLFGLPPWFIQISDYKSNVINTKERILEERQKQLRFPNNHVNPDILNIITKALQPSTANRFQNVDEFIAVLNGEKVLASQTFQEPTTPKSVKSTKKAGGGFEAIAGMQKLKDTLQLDVIDALNEKERYAEYGLTIPNGMLLYGPPGCGKTFFAECLSEEIGFNFYKIKPSDIQSKWVNASQENIKKLFDEARENAPSIIFIDELDAVVPNRNNSSVNHMNSSVVNEFLAQMNNSGEDGVFIIGATNRPDAIDPAVLRAGRLDKVIYLPPPDFAAREQMFKLYLDKRPRELGLNYADFATLTENYVSSDIKFLCDEAARKALKSKARITKVILSEVIKNNKSSLSNDELNNYVKLAEKIEGFKDNDNKRPRIGFNK